MNLEFRILNFQLSSLDYFYFQGIQLPHQARQTYHPFGVHFSIYNSLFTIHEYFSIFNFQFSISQDVVKALCAEFDDVIREIVFRMMKLGLVLATSQPKEGSGKLFQVLGEILRPTEALVQHDNIIFSGKDSV